MLAAISSHHKPIDTSQKISTDSVLSLPQIFPFDTIDNPVPKQFFIPDKTEENIFQQMKSECNRLYSFQNKWPLHDITPENLAEAGLFYLQKEDEVQCPFCYIKISNWTQEDKPLREHMRKSPKCPFLVGSDVGNIPLLSVKEHHTSVYPDSQKKNLTHSVNVCYKPKHPRMADVKRRLLTFSGWPLNEPGPQQLAECGLYYSGVADVVTCFFCGGTLGNWEPDDDPCSEHAKFFPECSFLALAKSKAKHSPKIVQSYGKELIKQNHSVYGPSSSDAMSEIVQQALDIFPEDLVLSAVKRKNGSPFSLQEICDDILELKQKPRLQTIPAIPQETNYKTKSSSASNIDLLLCKVCMDRERGVVFQPCGHFVTCWKCANLIADCPVCRRPITHKIKTYIS